VEDDKEIQAALEAADLPDYRRVDRDVLARRIRGAIRAYQTSAPPSHVAARADRDAMLVLWRFTIKVSAGRLKYAQALADAFERLSEDARCSVVARGSRLRRRVPTASELRNPVTATAAAERLRSLIQTGAAWKKGRRRAGGKQSQPTIDPSLYAPAVPPNRPPNEASRNLVLQLADAYQEATGREPPYTARRAFPSDPDLPPARPGPFARLVKAVLKLVGTPGVDEVELVNWCGRWRKRAERRRSQDSSVDEDSFLA
jgi:hypothetical protein